MQPQNNAITAQQKQKIILAFVGMPGAGKTEAAAYLTQKSIPFVRFGDLTDEGVQERGQALTPENERSFREHIRLELGMAAYAIKAEPRIKKFLETHDAVALDGLRSWEEYTYLKERFPHLTLINIFAEPSLRYKRLHEREIRPLEPKVSRERDVAELIQLNMGAPIAIADYFIHNDGSLKELQVKIDRVLERLDIDL